MPSKDDHRFNRYMDEVHSYLGKVQAGRRVAKVNPDAPKFNQAADDNRVGTKMGLANQMPQVPPQFSSPRGQDPFHYGFNNTYQPTGPQTPMHHTLRKFMQ